MDNSGAFTLGDFSITLPATYDGVNSLVDSLDGMIGFTAQAAVQAGSGTTDDATAAVYIATSIDQGTRWVDVAVMRFDAAGGVLLASVEAASTPEPITPTDGALADDSESSIVDGIMGDRLKAKIITTGTWGGGSVASIRVCVR